MNNVPLQILPPGTPDDAHSAAHPDEGQRYRFEHLTLPNVLRDMYYSSNDPGPGDRMPEFDLPIVGGGRFRSRDLVEISPALLIFGSITCPVTDNAARG